MEANASQGHNHKNAEIVMVQACNPSDKECLWWKLLVDPVMVREKKLDMYVETAQDQEYKKNEW